MSLEHSITIVCDWCNSFQESYAVEEEWDAERCWENQDNIVGCNIDGYYYSHICWDCRSEMTYCNWCENDDWGTDWLSCGDMNILVEHDECWESFHEEHKMDLMNDDESGIFECQDCGYRYLTVIDRIAVDPHIPPTIYLQYAKT